MTVSRCEQQEQKLFIFEAGICRENFGAWLVVVPGVIFYDLGGFC